MERALGSAPPAIVEPAGVRAAIDHVLGRPERPSPACRHAEPTAFVPGEPLELTLAMRSAASSSRVRVHYRHVNQAERYRIVEMRLDGRVHRATIPGDYTQSRFPLQYYFELRQGTDAASLYPGFAPDLANVPYFVVRGRDALRPSDAPDHQGRRQDAGADAVGDAGEQPPRRLAQPGRLRHRGRRQRPTGARLKSTYNSQAES
jgi:hypothetical protein